MKFFEFFAIFTVMVTGLNGMIPNGVQVGDLDSFGQVQNPETFPYIVHLEIVKLNTTTNEYQLFTCGGSIIRTNVILTAAHCVEGALPESVIATAGIVHIGIFQESQQSIAARRIVCHEEFHFPKNDIAVVFLVDKFQKSTYIDTIPLAKPFQYRDYMSVTAVGWGLLTDERQTEWLHRGDFLMLDKTSCAQKMNTFDYNYYEELLCVVDRKGLQKLGHGDSGGPLVKNNALVGVSVTRQEHPTGVYDPTLPSIFSNVSHYTNWISEKIGYDILFFE